jgi:hypothetical protein
MLSCSSSQGSGQPSLPPTTHRPAPHRKRGISRGGVLFTLRLKLLYLLTILPLTPSLVLLNSCFDFPHHINNPSLLHHINIPSLQTKPTSWNPYNQILSLANNVPLSLSQMRCRHLEWKVLRFMRCCMFPSYSLPCSE